MAEICSPVLDFGNDIPVKNIEAQINESSFRDFEKAFAPFVKKRESIYSRIPGGGTWPSFEPAREKILEYYLTLRALSLEAKSTYLDVASGLSLFPNFVAERIGATVYRQDWFYPRGIEIVEFPRIIRRLFNRTLVPISCMGCDVRDFPLGDSTVDHITLHCSLEHFEGDADRLFISEAFRVLNPRGRILIIPFYCGDKYQELYKKEFANGCQFHRYYDPPSFVERVLSSIDVPYSLEMRYYRNSRSIDESFYCDYSLVVIKQ